ncbi:MAG: c-type cytochrome [Acidobacteria bacterium]|nr:c-type cytochrome [Acidobacteriota bacterium]
MIWLALLLAQAPADPVVLAQGEKVFAQSCAIGYCHGAGGAGNRGPRLRGRTFEAARLDSVIRYGIPNSAMPGFNSRLKEDEIRAVNAYVMSLASPGTSATAPVAAASVPPLAPVSKSRGEELFFDATREVRCATCHEVSGRGVPVVGLSAGKVRRARLKDGDSFPALVASEAGDVMKLYDLTVAPPVLRTIERSSVVSLDSGATWDHKKATAEYSEAELRQINEFLRTAEAAGK